MIKKLHTHPWVDERGTVYGMMMPDNQEIMAKINELIDVVNTLIEENNFHEKQIDALHMDLKQLKDAFIVRLDENDEPATATPVSSVLETDNE